ncbi:MAG: DUF1501 domain-containing protein [Pirellulales bacterium]
MATLATLARPSACALRSDQLPSLIPRAKRVIFLFMQGGVSQVDSWDYKPLLADRDGQFLPFADARILANTGQARSDHRVMRSPWKFRQYGQSGRWVSDLFPHVARHVDKLCLIHSMHTEGVAHGPATLFLHCGATTQIRPSIGSWISYGLGSDNENLPAFVTLAPPQGNGGTRNYGSAFLPAIHQGTALGRAGTTDDQLTIRHLRPNGLSESDQRAQLDLVRRLNETQLQRRGEDSELQAVVESYELGWRMQSVAPEVLDLGQESLATHERYGVGRQPTDGFARKCLLARRLCESGVRFVQVNYGDNTANPAWDQHSNLPKHADHAAAVDQPIAALLEDLDQRGLLDDTLVWWGGEFGRTPYAEKDGTGRDHNPNGFTVWLAGGGIRPGIAYGSTDEFGHVAVADKVHMHDLHATILHQLGLDHQRLTFQHAGRNFRLTDVYGRVVKELVS